MNLIDRVKNILTRPNLEWDLINNEPPATNLIIGRYVIPLIGAAALAAFIGYAFIGIYHFHSITSGLVQALIVFLGNLLAVFIIAFVVDVLAPLFDSEKDYPRSLQLVAYSFTPAWIGGLLAIFPPIAILGSLFGLYSFYLMYLGMPKLKRTPPDKLIPYLVVTLIIAIVVIIIIRWLLSSLLRNLFDLSYGPLLHYNY